MKSFSGLWGNHMAHLVDCYLSEDSDCLPGLSSSPSPRRHPWTPRLLRPESGPPPSACCSLQDRSQQTFQAAIWKYLWNLTKWLYLITDMQSRCKMELWQYRFGIWWRRRNWWRFVFRMFRWWHHPQWQRRGTGDWTMLNVRREMNTVLILFTMLSSTNLEVRSWRETILFSVSSVSPTLGQQ